jgi:TonB family protein
VIVLRRVGDLPPSAPLRNVRQTVSVDTCYKVFVLLVCLTCADLAPAEEDPAATSGDPTKIGLMTPAAKSALDNCPSQAAEIAGDDKDRRAMIGLYIGSKGRPVSLAILESSGLEQLDKLVLRCVFRADFTPAAPDKPPIHWVFTMSLKAKRVPPIRSSSAIVLRTLPATDALARCA